MESMIDAAHVTDGALQDDAAANLSFLPPTLMMQCRSLIESYHDVHGFASLPNMLWRFRMGPLIERHDELRQVLRRASTTRSAKKANEGFVRIASTILALEILASRFAGWNTIYPAAGEAARSVLKHTSRGSHAPLMEFYLYPPKQISAAAIATLAPPVALPTDERAIEPASEPELSAERRALHYASQLRRSMDLRP